MNVKLLALHHMSSCSDKNQDLWSFLLEKRELFSRKEDMENDGVIFDDPDSNFNPSS